MNYVGEDIVGAMHLVRCYPLPLFGLYILRTSNRDILWILLSTQQEKQWFLYRVFTLNYVGIVIPERIVLYGYLIICFLLYVIRCTLPQGHLICLNCNYMFMINSMSK